MGPTMGFEQNSQSLTSDFWEVKGKWDGQLPSIL